MRSGGGCDKRFAFAADSAAVVVPSFRDRVTTRCSSGTALDARFVRMSPLSFFSEKFREAPSLPLVGEAAPFRKRTFPFSAARSAGGTGGLKWRVL